MVLYKRLVQGHHWTVVREDLGGRFCKKTQKSILARLDETGGVEIHQGRRPGPPANQEFDATHDQLLLQSLAENPQFYHRERRSFIALTDGKRVDVATICRAVQRAKLKRQRPDNRSYGWILLFNGVCGFIGAALLFSRSLQELLPSSRENNHFPRCGFGRSWTTSTRAWAQKVCFSLLPPPL